MLHLLYSKVIVPHCTAHFYGIVIGSLRLIKFVLHTLMCIENFFDLLTKSSASVMYARYMTFSTKKVAKYR